MRKSVLLFLFALVSLSAFSQIKHNKFTTKITFDQFNPSPAYWNTSVSEIKDNSGYFLTNHYDDQVYGFHPSLIKLDVDGSIVLDTVYEYTPNNSFGYTNIVNTHTTNNTHTALYQTSSLNALGTNSPYIINYDLNGNVNWHQGFTDDTLDLEVSKLVPTLDGGYLIVGTLDDWVNLTYPTSGYAIKLSGSGNVMWYQMYTNNDSIRVKFKDAINTPDGGFFFVGDAPNFTGGGAKLLNPFDILTCMVKTDNFGNVLWSKGSVFDAPIDNQYGPSDFSTGILNDSSAFVSVFVNDSTGNGQDKFTITSVNLINGNHNWTKVYSLPVGENISIRKAISDDNGNIIVSASYYGIPSSGVIFVIDQNGNLVDTKRFSHLAPNFPYETIRTMDGGFVHVSEIDQNKVLVVKTDGNLDPSCAAIDSTFQFSLNSTIIGDTSYFGMVDSIYTLQIIGSVQMPFGTAVATSSDDSLICSCSNTIQGTVTQGGITPVNNAKVLLFKKGVVPKPWQPIDSTITDAAGNYQFNYVPTDSFIVRVEPDTTLFPGALVSYFKEPTWCYRWDLAGVFSVHCDSGVVQKDVKLVVPPALTGNSSLNGYVFESFGSFSKGNMQPGDPIPGIDITVDQSPGGIVGGSTTQANGYYSLSGLDTNKTYIVTIDYPGLPHDSIWTVNINLTDTTMDSLNFYIDSTGIYILNQPISTGLDVVNTKNIDVDLYPNPNNGMFTVKIKALKPEDVELQIVDKVGKVISTSVKRVLKGENNIIFNKTASLPAGIYFLKIKEKNNIHIKKIVKL